MFFWLKNIRECSFVLKVSITLRHYTYIDLVFSPDANACIFDHSWHMENFNKEPFPAVNSRQNFYFFMNTSVYTKLNEMA